MSAERVRVCAAGDLEPGDREIVSTPEGEVGVFNVDGNYYAVENQCAHQGGPVCTGKQQGALQGEVTGLGERVSEFFSEEVPAIACPWHGWEYDLRTGQHLGDPEYGIAAYDVVEDGGELYVEL